MRPVFSSMKVPAIASDMAKEIMKKFTGPGLQNLAGRFGFLAPALMVLLLTVDTGRAQTSFTTPGVLSGNSGYVVNDNTGVMPDPGAPSTAGFPPNAPLWYSWTAPVDGEVTLDTVGSVDDIFLQPLDTVLGVYTGNTLGTLSQVAANDDLYPIYHTLPNPPAPGNTQQYNETGSGDYGIFVGPGGLPVLGYQQLYNGPSHLRFNAKGGVTYYFVVDTKNPVTGNLSLNWAYQPSGVFRFATEDIDFLTGLPLYQTAATESLFPQGLNNNANSVILSYYTFNVRGCLVTVTRSAGSVGRVSVDYTTVDGTTLPSIPFNDTAAVAGVNYTPVSGTLIFDDYEMSKTILIPIIGIGDNYSNSVFGVQLSNPQLDPDESSEVSPPRVDTSFSTAMVKILNVNADPYGPDYAPVVTTNTVGTNVIVMTNLVETLFPTNPIFNFEKANYRVPADINNPTNSPWQQVTIYVERYGTNFAATTLHYRVNNLLGDDQDASEEQNIFFPLQPGSDYAVPTPPYADPIRGTNSDYVLTQGTISFPSTGPGSLFQPITFTVPVTTLTKFNKDFRIQLYREAPVGNQTVPWIAGMVSETCVTILYEDQNPPAGSVDEVYNADFNQDLALYPPNIPITTPQNNPNPGTSGQVNSLAVLTNDETVVVGDFPSYNGFGRSRVALVNTDGSLDTTFDPGSGANDFISAVALTPGNQIVIGGGFTSYNGSQRNGIARLNLDGSLDTGFNPGWARMGMLKRWQRNRTEGF
jgi:hypothetical protein